MISHMPGYLLARGEKKLDFKHFLSRKTGVQLFGSSDWLYSRFFIAYYVQKCYTYIGLLYEKDVIRCQIRHRCVTLAENIV